MVSVLPRPFELALLQHPQELHLRADVDVADLVEKERSAFGELEAAFLPLIGSGKRALLVAEQLRFDQAVGKRRAAHFDERLVGARGVVMNPVRDHLLARARFAANEHGGVGRRHLGHLLVHLPDRPAAADDARKVVAFLELLAEVDVLVDQALLVLFDEPLHFDGLRDRRGDDAVELDAAIVVTIRLELEINAERADRAPVQQNRHADEAQLFARQLGPFRRPVEERRLLAHARHHDRLAAFDNLADDAFADPVAHGVRRRIQAIGGLDVQLAVLVQHRDQAADGPVVL